MQSQTGPAGRLASLGDHVVGVVLAAPGARAGGGVLDAVCILVFGALAGLAMGLWTDGAQLLYVPTKVPLLLGGSLGIGFPAMFVLGRLLGCPLGAGEAGRLALSSVARSAVVLGALAPASACYALSLPAGDPVAYHTIVLVQVAAVGIAGFVGVTALRGRLGAILSDRRRRRRVAILWVGVYSFVGAQLTWLLRPWLATPGLPLEYLRSYDALGLESNFYVAVWRLVGHWFRG